MSKIQYAQIDQSSAVILARVSSKSQEDEGYSLDSQLKLLTAYCENRNLRVVRVFKITETASKQQSRKVFQELLKFMDDNNIYHLAVEKTDRLTRNFRDAVSIDDWLEQDGHRMLHAVKENIELHKDSKSDVKFMWNIHLAVAKKYTDNLREEAMKGWAEKLAQGWLPSSPPPGYMTITENGKRIHVPDPATKGIVQHLFKQYLDPNQSIKSITREMALLGVLTSKGRPYSKSHVHRIMSNPFYIGINHFDGKDYPGAQEPILTKQLFDHVQQKMRTGRPFTLKKHNPVFKNIIHCNGCKGVVTWQRQKGKYYGSCQRTSPACKGSKFLREDKVEEAVMEMLKKLVCPSEEVIDWVANSMRKEQQQNTDNRERILVSIDTQLSRVQRMDNDLYDDKLAGDIEKDRYEAKHADFIAQITDLKEQRARIDSTVSQDLERRLLILELAQKAANLYPNKTTDQKRLIITKLFTNLTYDGGVVSVNYTIFCKAIAENVFKTSNLMGGTL